MDVRLPDGTLIQNVPDGTTKAQLVQKLQSNGMNVPKEWTSDIAPQQSTQLNQPTTQEKSNSASDFIGNLAAGAARGAGSIGATLLAPIDAAARAVGIENDIIGRRDRREAMTNALKSMGADPESLAFQTGKIGAEVAGTLPVGGVLGGLVSKVAPGAAGLAQALRTGGAIGPNLATRAAGGAATGAAAAGLVDPSEIETGAAIGAGLPVAGRAISAIAPALRRGLGATTGVGDEALSQAFQAGKAGGEQGKAFAEALRGQSSIDDVLSSAKQNLQAMGAQKQQAYREGMASVKADPTVLSFDGINDAIKRAAGMASFKGQAKNPQASAAVNDVANTVDEWMRLNPSEYHTPEGLDALKQRVGAALESIPFEQKTARSAVGDIYNSIKSEISSQAPEYSKVMRDYSEASELIGEIERALSLGKKASADTSMRKLQSLMRNNVNTSYGYRDQLAKQLEQAGGQSMMPALAGQALSEWTPRGIQRATSAATGGGLALTGNFPAAAGMAAISSPRLVGEGAYALGRGAGVVNPSVIEALRRGAYSSAPVIGAQ